MCIGQGWTRPPLPYATMPPMRGRWGPIAALVCALGIALAPSAVAAGPPSRPTTFRPRIANALGLIPPNNMSSRVIASALSGTAREPAQYHGGQVMAHGVTVHTIFWGAKGSFHGSPGHGIPTYEGLIEQFFTDVAHDSGRKSNVYSTLVQYAEGTKPGAITPGRYAIAYSKSADNIIDTHPYPKHGCKSAGGLKKCVSDEQVQHEVNRLITEHHGKRGLTQLWFVFLPPKVDECISPGSCGTDAFLGYHSDSDLGHGVVIYAVAIDPLIEGPVPKHQDPEGYPEAEDTIDTAAHETEESITDPEGVGYMDPNGYEVADKCERPVLGKPLGHAPDGAPYNQLINGHEYLFQEMWSNDNHGCVQRTTATHNVLPLPQINLVQFSPHLTGNIERKQAGVHVKMTLYRASAAHKPVAVASGTGTTSSSGAWSLSLGHHAVGDDRDELIVQYSGAGAPSPHKVAILPGNGHNPYTESGWTGWTEMDYGSRASNHPPSLELGPCFQTGVEHYAIGGKRGASSPTKWCNTKTDVATQRLAAAPKAGQSITWSANDNRAFGPSKGAAAPNPYGGLVNMTVPVGQPGSVSLFHNPLHYFKPGGFPTCDADLARQRVSCAGLVPGQRYELKDGGKNASGKADKQGVVSAHLAVKGGEVVALTGGGRTLTHLHVANLRVEVKGNSKKASGGHCQPGEYYDPPLSKVKTNHSAGSLAGGLALTGEICPLNGNPKGLPVAHVVQTDEFSGGETQTEVAHMGALSLPNGATRAGAFVARARAQLSGSSVPERIALKIVRGAKTVFSARNVNTSHGVRVAGLSAGSYEAIWTVSDANGDTRTVVTRFTER